MRVKNVKKSLDRISKHLADRQDSREFLIKNTRDIVTLCSKSIMAVHGRDIKSAEDGVQRAQKLLAQYRKKTKGDLQRYLVVPEQEFVEASALIAIAKKKQIPSDGSLGVSPESYVLGLLDCIGELKRFILDDIRKDRFDEAVETFEIMEEMFSLLYPFAGLDKVVKETRRKLDVNRMLVENIRSVITEEMRRKELIKTIKKIQK